MGAIVYETKDQHFTSKACRQIENVDHTKPVIQILGSDSMTLEATHEGNYIDDGATCSDQVDGVISQNVEVSGDVVNLSKVGSYTITYNCKDSAGHGAPTLSRYVHVAQTSCPTCVITGKDELTHEASFPYTDQGAVCTDIIDGTVTAETVDSVDVGKTGKYVLTYRAKNSVGLWNDGLAADGEDHCRHLRACLIDGWLPGAQGRARQRASLCRQKGWGSQRVLLHACGPF